MDFVLTVWAEQAEVGSDVVHAVNRGTGHIRDRHRVVDGDRDHGNQVGAGVIRLGRHRLHPASGRGGPKRVLAPIDDAKVVPGAQPGTFVVQAKAGLPGGCAKQGGYEVAQQGPNLITVVTVTIYNTMPVANVPCTAIYGMYDVTADLGLLSPDRQYEIHVNDKTVPFP